MIGISSNNAGVLLLPKAGIKEYSIIDVVEGVEQDPIEFQYLYSAAKDWKEIEGSDASALLEIATQEYWLERTVSHLRFAISRLENSLEKRVLENIEENLSIRVSSEKVLDRLLIAPLTEQYSSLKIANSALSYGFLSVAAIFEELGELQPLLRRLTDIWLSLPETQLSNSIESKLNIWTTITETCGMKKLLIASNTNTRELTAQWNLLTFHFPTPSSRSRVNLLGKELSRRLFPNEDQEESITTSLSKEAKTMHYYEEEIEANDHEKYENVNKQIKAIANAISQGRIGTLPIFLD